MTLFLLCSDKRPDYIHIPKKRGGTPFYRNMPVTILYHSQEKKYSRISENLPGGNSLQGKVFPPGREQCITSKW